jgi:hypothetical protein
MSDALTFVRVTGSESAPAVFNPGWIPDGHAFPELTEARATYLRLLAAYQAAGARARGVEQRILEDTARRDGALRDAFTAGEANPTPEPEDQSLKAELAAARQVAQAAVTAYLDHINNTIALVIEHRQEWQSAIMAFQQSVDSEVEALVSQARELRAKRGDYGRLQHWIDRTALDGAEMPAAHFPYSDIAAPATGDPVEEEARLRQFMLDSYAGGIAPDQPISEAQMRQVQEGNIAAHRQTPEAEDGEVELSDLDDEDLVDWLMGTGMFDGHTKPSAALVAEAAGDDPSMAKRLLQAEGRANIETPRPELLAALTEISNGKAAIA